MHTQNPLTQQAYKRLVSFLESVGNTLNIQHKMALHSLVDAMTRMAEGKITGRLAFGLPTGTGKTSAIIEWCASVHALKLPYSIAVSSSRIDALVTMKAAMLEAGIPEDKIGLLHESKTDKHKKAPSNTDAENQDRQILLMSHQMIRASETNLKRYNTYKGAARNLLIYDESLLTSDVRHFTVRSLCAAIAHAIETYKRHDNHETILNFLTEVKRLLEAIEDGFFEGMAFEIRYLDQPYLDPTLATHYAREWRKHGMIADFLQAANVQLRILCAGTSAVVTYDITMPNALENVLVLDASFPIRKLEQSDKTIHDAETYLNLKRRGVDFSTIKKFDHVELFRLKSYGGRHSMEKRFKDGQMAKEVVEVIKTIPESEPILCYVYKNQQPYGGTDYGQILKTELVRAGLNPDRVSIDTFGNETSLNSYGHCTHVFLVGILHRSETELIGQYLGQIRDISGEITEELSKDLCLSERAHLAYQALSRGCCRFSDNGQAREMKGYIVEIDPGIEDALSTVMPGVNWTNWKPVFLPDTDSLVEQVRAKVDVFLSTFEQDKISSRKLKSLMGLGTVAPRTWARVISAFSEQCQASKEKKFVRGGTVRWNLVGQSLVRVSAESFGFAVAEKAA